MSENPTGAPVPLPSPMRYLTNDEYSTAIWYAIKAGAALDDNDVDSRVIARAALASVGLFAPPDSEVEDPDPSQCTALSLRWDIKSVDNPAFIGKWDQCSSEPGHGTTDHVRDIDFVRWSDGEPGSVPARPPVPLSRQADRDE
ncbi:hypothetical protein ABT294_25675 [Nonomuraea sp. NPDC000554]|uniref:hypothetical protein n=1 Tax=Nonomuraea sp. NPDC000554 TaxID=3154259 RepID=UPI003319157F